MNKTLQKAITCVAVLAVILAVGALTAHVVGDWTAMQFVEGGGVGMLGLAGSLRWSERNVVVKGLDPVADAFAATVYSDVVRMVGDKVTFLIYKGVGATGTLTVTVQACDDFVPTNRTAVPFRYRRCCNTADVQGAFTAAAAAGFDTTAGSSEIYVIEVLAEDMGSSNYPNVQLKMVEVVDSPVLGGILTLVEPAFSQAIHPTVIS